MIRNFFGKIWSSWKSTPQSRKAILLAVFVILVVGVSFVPAWHSASAAPATETAGFSPLDMVLNIISRLLLGLTRLALSLLLFVITFIIEVAGYNGFLRSDAVNIGWVMIRDLTNMVFVVALLIIAFGTILGVEHYEWKHMLFKLVSAAILVNFSRTICGVIIDVSQVVMTTFVNGIAVTASGNVIRAFSLDSIQGFANAQGTDMTAINVWLSATAAFFISVTVLVATGALLAMLVARVVVLWVLIVLSPVAFVFSILHQTEHYAEDWWSAFGKNVITGPVLTFFLWLTLVTVGNGNISNHLANYSTTPTPVTAGSQAFDQTSGIGSALKWDNLVNFAIAIGMLLVGLKITHHLGGVGAEWSEHAVEYGKEAAIGLSGIGLVRSGATAVANAPKAAVEHGVELVKEKGLETIKNRAITPIVSRAKIGMSRLRMDRNEVVKGWEKERKDVKEFKDKLDGRLARGEITKEQYDEEYKRQYGGKYVGGGLRILKRLAGGFVETGGRAEKRAKDWEEAAETQKEIEEEEFSTSSSASGKTKLELSVIRHQLEEKAAAGKKKKMADKAQELLNAGGDYALREEEIHKLEAEGERTETRLKTHAEEGKLEAQTAAGLFAAKAESESQVREVAKRREIAVAIERDRQLPQGQKPHFLEAVLAAHNKEIADQYSALNWREVTERARIASEELAAMNSDVITDQFKAQAEVAMGALQAAMGRGAEATIQALGKASAARGRDGRAIFDEEVKAGDTDAMERQLLSVLYGQHVHAGEEKAEAKRKLTEAYGGEPGFMRHLRNLDKLTKNVSAEFAPNLAGLIDDRTADRNGNIVYRTETNAEVSAINKDYQAGSIKMEKVLSLTGMVTTVATPRGIEVTRNSDSIDQRSIDNVVMVFRNIKNNTKLDPRLVKEWGALAPEVKERILSGFEHEVGASNPEAVGFLRKSLGAAPRGPRARPAPDDDDENEPEPGEP